MVKLFSILAVLVATTLTVWGVIKNDGTITIEWMDFHIETSFIFAVLVIFFCLLMFTLAFNFLSYLRNFPANFTGKIKDNKIRQQLNTLIDGFSALVIEDYDKAKSESKKLSNLHKNKKLQNLVPIANILHAELSKKTGNIDDALKANNELLYHKETKLFGLKGLIALKIQTHKYNEALLYAEEAITLSSKNKFLLYSLLEIYNHLHLWEKSENILKKIISLEQGTKEFIVDQYEIIYLNHSRDLIIKNKFDDAIVKLEKLLNISPTNTQALKEIVSLYCKFDKHKQGQKILEKGWKIKPDLEFISLYLDTISKDNIVKKISKIESLKNMTPDNYEGYIALANLYLEEGNIPKARNIMEEVLDKFQVNQHISKIMAKIEVKSSAKMTEIFKWLDGI